MATPREHAVVTASGYERWSHCTAAPRYEEQFPNGTSVYAEEGTLAHAVCELMGRKKFTPMSTRKYNADLKKLQEKELWDDEMLKTAEFYVNHLAEKANTFPAMPHVAFEVRVDLTDYIPDGFGTCDCIMIGGDTLRITDYKHGKGVPVSSIGNGQMRLYALGALKRYAPVYGDQIKRVVTSIVQPRVTEDVVEEEITVEALIEWGLMDAKPKAQLAYTGMGNFEPGEWCRFCKGKAQCRARAELNAGFEQYANMIPQNATPKQGQNPCLSDAEIADLLVRASGLCAWYADLESYATQTILTGGEIPGFKVVEGRKVRQFRDADHAIEIMQNAGYDEAMLYDRKQKTLAQIEKLTGKKEFAALMDGEIVWSVGKPTLVPESDKREAYTPTGPNEFAGVTDDGSSYSD